MQMSHVRHIRCIFSHVVRYTVDIQNASAVYCFKYVMVNAVTAWRLILRSHSAVDWGAFLLPWQQLGIWYVSVAMSTVGNFVCFRCHDSSWESRMFLLP